jgi:hypothetical protein
VGTPGLELATRSLKSSLTSLKRCGTGWRFNYPRKPINRRCLWRYPTGYPDDQCKPPDFSILDAKYLKCLVGAPGLEPGTR